MFRENKKRKANPIQPLVQNIPLIPDNIVANANVNTEEYMEVDQVQGFEASDEVLDESIPIVDDDDIYFGEAIQSPSTQFIGDNSNNARRSRTMATVIPVEGVDFEEIDTDSSSQVSDDDMYAQLEDSESDNDEFAQFDEPITSGFDDNKLNFYSASITRAKDSQYFKVSIINIVCCFFLNIRLF